MTELLCVRINYVVETRPGGTQALKSQRRVHDPKPGRRVVNLRATAHPWNEGFRGVKSDGTVFLRVIFDDGEEYLLDADSVAIERLLFQLGLWLPQPRAEVRIGPPEHGACADCSACHHRQVTPAQAMQALGARPSSIRHTIGRLASEQFFAVDMPSLYARLADRAGIAPSLLRWVRIGRRPPPDPRGELVAWLAGHVGRTNLWEVVGDPDVTS